MINPECLINYRFVKTDGSTWSGYLVARLPLGREWSTFTDNLKDEIVKAREEDVTDVVFTSITKLP